jgi:hypothetical protein
LVEGQGGDAIAISELVGYGDVYKERVQEKVQQILREFDVRCSYCKADDPPKMCPCKKERYCDAGMDKNRFVVSADFSYLTSFCDHFICRLSENEMEVT